MFIGREKELNLIEKRINSDNFEFGLLYGRRRIGKTFLLKELLNKHKAIYFVASEMSYEYNIKNLSSNIATYFNEPVMFNDISDIFKYLISKSNKEKIILIIDEFTYLIDNNPGILSIIQNIIDDLANNKNIKIILSGSHIGMIEDAISYKKPLYGRATFKLKLEPFDYYDAAKFYPNIDSLDKVRYYSIFGGIPFYLSKINQNISLKENVINLIIDEYAMFNNEVDFFLKQEVRSVNTYGLIINAIASGATKLNEITTKSKVSTSGTLSKYINTLIQLGIVEKVTCFGEGKNSRKTIYKIVDQLFNFHYNFIESNLSSKTIMKPEQFYEQYIKVQLDDYVSFEFERVAQQYLKRKYYNTIQDIGNYWFNDRLLKKDIEIDVMMLNNNKLSAYECKWTNKIIDSKVVKSLENKVLNLDVKELGFFSKSGFSDEIRGYTTFTVDDLYNL